jgi:hypothetical protein
MVNWLILFMSLTIWALLVGASFGAFGSLTVLFGWRLPFCQMGKVELPKEMIAIHGIGISCSVSLLVLFGSVGLWHRVFSVAQATWTRTATCDLIALVIVFAWGCGVVCFGYFGGAAKRDNQQRTRPNSAITKSPEPKTWGALWLFHWTAAVVAVGMMWLAVATQTGLKQGALVESRETLQDGLYLAAFAMIASVMFVGSKSEIEHLDDKRIPSIETIKSMRALGAFWSLLLITSYIPAYIELRTHAHDVLSAGLAPAATFAQSLEIRKNFNDVVGLESAGITATSLLSLLAPFLSGLLPGLGKTEK